MPAPEAVVRRGLAGFNPRAGPPDSGPPDQLLAETARSLAIGNAASMVDFLASQLKGWRRTIPGSGEFGGALPPRESGGGPLKPREAKA